VGNHTELEEHGEGAHATVAVRHDVNLLRGENRDDVLPAVYGMLLRGLAPDNGKQRSLLVLSIGLVRAQDDKRVAVLLGPLKIRQIGSLLSRRAGGEPLQTKKKKKVKRGANVPPVRCS